MSNDSSVEITVKMGNQTYTGTLKQVPWYGDQPPLFTVAFTNIEQNLQTIAKYPFVILDQGNTTRYTLTYPQLKIMNPEMKQLAYLQVMGQIFPSAQPMGAGDNILKNVNDPSSYCYVNGVPVTYTSSGLQRKVRDCRSTIWKTAFVQAAAAIMNAYPFDGIFFDNCTIFNICNPDPKIRNDMRLGLIAAIDEIRVLFPKAILIGNGSSVGVSTGLPIIKSLNGSMTEGRNSQIPDEGSVRNYTSPVYNLAVDLVSNYSDQAVITNSQLAFDNKMAYCIGVNFTQYFWTDTLQKIKDSFK